jgi:hypothetical protein
VLALIILTALGWIVGKVKNGNGQNGTDAAIREKA